MLSVPLMTYTDQSTLSFPDDVLSSVLQFLPCDLHSTFDDALMRSFLVGDRVSHKNYASGIVEYSAIVKVEGYKLLVALDSGLHVVLPRSRFRRAFSVGDVVTVFDKGISLDGVVRKHSRTTYGFQAVHVQLFHKNSVSIVPLNIVKFKGHAVDLEQK